MIKSNRLLKALKLARGRKDVPRFRTSDCALLARHYAELQQRSGLLVPPRKSLNLKSVPSVAPYFGIFEVKSLDTILVRLVGTGFVLRTGIDNTGRNMLELIPSNLRAWTKAHFQRILNTPCGSLCVSREAYGSAQMLTEVIALPFTGADDARTLIVSASIPFERPSYRPREDGMEIGGFSEVAYFDVGAGVGG